MSVCIACAIVRAAESRVLDEASGPHTAGLITKNCIYIGKKSDRSAGWCRAQLSSERRLVCEDGNPVPTAQCLAADGCAPFKVAVLCRCPIGGSSVASS